jgi:predicted Zn-dependent protease with MMP-like domain
MLGSGNSMAIMAVPDYADNRRMPADADFPLNPGSGEGSAADAADGPAELDSAAPDPFESMVWDAVDALPDAFRQRLDSVAIVVEDEPSAEDLARTGAVGLLGLYTGVPRTAYGASEAAFASKITIYRGAHFRQFGVGPALAEGVAATVRHEVAHHFGISDARLIELSRGNHG